MALLQTSSYIKMQVEASVRNKMGSTDSFELVRKQFIEEYDSEVLLYKHKKTGAAAGHAACPLSRHNNPVTASVHWQAPS